MFYSTILSVSSCEINLNIPHLNMIFTSNIPQLNMTLQVDNNYKNCCVVTIICVSQVIRRHAATANNVGWEWKEESALQRVALLLARSVDSYSESSIIV